MTAIKTMNIRIVDPNAERLIVDLASRNLIEIEEPLSAQEEWMRLGQGMAERRRQAGLPEEDPMTMDEVVAIIKESRAERYAKKQKIAANS